MRTLTTKSRVVGRLGRPTNARKLRGFSPDCGQKTHLSHVYEVAANRHRSVADLLTSPLAPLNESEHTKVYVRVELAKLEVEDARKALARHVTEHGC
jgi:hypothetical protein